MKIATKALALAWLAVTAGCATPQGETMNWVTGWATSHNARAEAPAMSGRTVRMVMLPNVAGTAVRVKLENTMGQSPVTFSGAYIAAAGEGAALRGPVTRLTFGGKPGLTLGAGEGAYSDPAALPVRAFEKVALSLEVQSASDISTHHVGLVTNWSAPGARGADAAAAGFEPLPEIPALNTGQWPFYWVAALDVQSAGTAGTIVLFADSISDGRCSTRDDKGIVQPNLYQRWGDIVARRLAAEPQRRQWAIANAGISGNRVLNRGNGPSALERLERDVLDRAGVTHVVFFEGTNDIAGDFTAPQIIAGTQKIVAELKARGIKVIGATVIPRGSATVGPKWTAAHERERLALNAWLRSSAAGFDGLIDFDAMMQGSQAPLAGGGTAPAIPAAWNCDGVHPNAAGYKAMGESVDLKLFD
jgi:lysophospholipase L1-like esterase